MLHALLIAALALAGPAPAGAAGPPVKSIQDLVASVPDRADDKKLQELSAITHRIAARPQAAYDPVARVFRIRVPEELLAVEQPGDAPDQKRVTSYRFAPGNREKLGVLDFPCSPAEAPKLADDLEVLVDFRVAPAAASSPGRPAVARRRTAHAATKGEPWKGTLEVVSLMADLQEMTLVRASTGEVLGRRRAGDPPPAPVAGSSTSTGPASRRRAFDNYGRAGSQWTMKDQHTYLEGCRAWLKDEGDALARQRRCRCMVELMQIRYPQRPPERIPAAEEEAIRTQCAPGKLPALPAQRP